MGQAESQTIAVSYPGDVHAARNVAKTMALTIGFNSTASEEIALAVSELATNLVKHTAGGTLLLQPLFEHGRAGMQIEAHDCGPGIKDTGQALADGFSTVGSLGYGLGAINRLMDEFDLTSQPYGPDHGTRIVCKRFVRLSEAIVTPGPLEFAAATRAHPFMDVNGDAFVLKQWGQSALVGVIDGLGHGQYALRAAQAARQYVESHYDQPLNSIFLGAGRACRATRGVVMALARFDWAPEPAPITLTFASIGNIEAHIFGKRESMNLIVRRGILGVNTANPVVTEHRWEPSYVLALHSDGVSSHWHWTDFELTQAPAATIAQQLLRRQAKDQDDATVVVVRSATSKNPQL